MTKIVTANSAVSNNAAEIVAENQQISTEELLGMSAAEYVKLQAKAAELKAQVKALETRMTELKNIFKTHRSGEMNEVIQLKYKKSKYTIAFKDSTRSIMDQSAVKSEYAALGKTVPMKQIIATTLDVIRA